MELVEGEDLRGPVPVETALYYARQIAAGLEAAHEKAIVHRDLKPANIKVTPQSDSAPTRTLANPKKKSPASSNLVDTTTWP
jgi:serine/threonine protein kinase